MTLSEVQVEFARLRKLTGLPKVIIEEYRSSVLDFANDILQNWNDLGPADHSTALLYAVLKKEKAWIKSFTENNGQVAFAAQYPDLGTALHVVAMEGDRDLLTYMVDVCGANINSTDQDKKDVLQRLLDVPMSVLPGEGQAKRNQMVEFLLSTPMMRNHKDNQGYDALYYATKNGYTDIAVKLIADKSSEHVLRINDIYPDNTTALYWAFKNKDILLQASVLSCKDLDFGSALRAVHDLYKSTTGVERQAVKQVMKEMIAVCLDPKVLQEVSKKSGIKGSIKETLTKHRQFLIDKSALIKKRPEGMTGLASLKSEVSKKI